MLKRRPLSDDMLKVQPNDKWWYLSDLLRNIFYPCIPVFLVATLWTLAYARSIESKTPYTFGQTSAQVNDYLRDLHARNSDQTTTQPASSAVALSDDSDPANPPQAD